LVEAEFTEVHEKPEIFRDPQREHKIPQATSSKQTLPDMSLLKTPEQEKSIL